MVQPVRVVLVVAVAAALVLVVHRSMLTMERRGWVYYRTRRRGAMGAAAMFAVTDVLQPSARSAVLEQEAQQRRGPRRPAPGDGGHTEDVIETARLLIRPTRPEDLPALRVIRALEEVRRWWGPAPQQDVGPEGEHDAGQDWEVERLTVLLDGRVLGLVEVSEETDPDYRHAGIDIYLDPSVHGRGLGTEAVDGVARYLFEQRGHHRVTIDPAAENVRAIACYRRVGFRAVGVLRRYERTSDGHWRDGLLMDLLPDDLRSPAPPAPSASPASTGGPAVPRPSGPRADPSGS